MGTQQCFQCKTELDALHRCPKCGVTSRVGGFTSQRLVAQTQSSRLYQGVDAKGAQVAIKELLFALVPDVKQLEAFERETAFLKQLQHPDVPRFVESLTVGDGPATRLYLVQQWIEGETVAARIERYKRLSEAEVVAIARSVLGTLIALHERTPSILHRDIKPANLLLRADGGVALVDFGVARELRHDMTHGSTLVGTYGYMPPEQLGGSVDASSDLYALGATLAHAISGKAPEQMLRDGMFLEIKTDVAVSPALLKFLRKLTASKRAERFRTAREALAALERPARSATPMLAAAAAVLVLAPAVAVLFVRGSAPKPVAVAEPAALPPPVARAAPVIAPEAEPAPVEEALPVFDATGCVKPPGGMVSWWRGEKTAKDSVGHNDGMLQSAKYGAGRVGWGFVFDGRGLLIAPTAGLPTGNADRTLELWARVDQATVGDAVFAGYGSFGSYNAAYALGTSGLKPFWTQWGDAVFGQLIPLKEWTHVAVTTRRTVSTLYVNGAKAAERPLRVETSSDSQLVIGRVPGELGDTRKLNGAVDEITVYDRALSPKEIAAIFAAGSAGKCAR